MGNCCLENTSNLMLKVDWEVPNNTYEQSYLKSENAVNNDLLLSPMKKVNFIKLNTNRNGMGNQSVFRLSTEAYIRNKTKKGTLENNPKAFTKQNKGQFNRQHSSSQCVHRNVLLKQLSDRNNSKETTNGLIYAKDKSNRTNESIDHERFSPVNVSRINNTNSNGVIGPHYEEKIIETELSVEEQKNLVNILSQHHSFRTIDKHGMKRIMESLVVFEIQSDFILFQEGEEALTFYIVKEGKVLLYDNESEKILSNNDTFGELTFVKGENTRKYSTKALTNLVGYGLEKNHYIQIMEECLQKAFSSSCIDRIYLLKTLNDNDKDKVKSLITYEEYEKNDLIKGKNCMIIFNNASVQYTINNTNGYPLSQGMPICLNHLFNPSLPKIFELKAKEKLSCFRISEYALREVLGLNYKNRLLIDAFNTIIKGNVLLSKIQKETKLNNKQLMDAFHIKTFKNEEIIYAKGTIVNNSLAILNGDLINSKSESGKLAKAGDCYQCALLLRPQEIEKDIIASGEVVTYETTIENLLMAIEKHNPKSNFLKILDALTSKFRMFQHISLNVLIENVCHIKVKNYKKSQLIIAQNQTVNYMYLINEGTVKSSQEEHKNNFRIIEEGNSFGDLIILSDEGKSPYNIVAKSEIVTCFLLSSEYFMQLLEETKFNDFIRGKMCLEENNITLNDLYYSSYLGRGRFGNVCLVHNEICFYAIKAISKTFAEKEKFLNKYLLSEKNAMNSLDHPFIGKLIKTFKNDNWCFFLEEYISGKNMGEYFDTKHVKRNLQETKFYAASMFMAISYIHSKKLIHRDLKPSNMMIDRNGYIKIIDFGTAIKLKKDKTKTLIGTPNFLAPEILGGKGYSFPCDYWSIGVCLYFIFYGQLPFGNSTSLEMRDTYDDILTKEVSFPDTTHNNLNSLISSLLCKNDQLRYSDFKAIQAHPLFKDFNWDDLINYRLKPTYIPEKDIRGNEENLRNLNTPFTAFMDTEKFDTKTNVTMKYSNKNVIPSRKLTNNQLAAWFDDF